MTGLTYYSGELNANRLELLKAVAPGIRRVAVLNRAHIPCLLAPTSFGQAR